MRQQLLYIVSLVMKSNHRQEALPKRDGQEGWPTAAQPCRIDEPKGPREIAPVQSHSKLSDRRSPPSRSI
jgi:hypothetical protein